MKRGLVIAAVSLVAAAVVLVLFLGRRTPLSVTSADLRQSMSQLRELYLSMRHHTETGYDMYLADAPQTLYTGETMTFTAEGGEEIYLSELEDGWARYRVTVPQDALYALAFAYRAEGVNVLQTVLSATIDGETPYAELASLQAATMWMTDGFPLDRYGNQCVSMPLRDNDTWRTGWMRAVTGRYSEPMLVYLTAGEHEIAIACQESAVTLRELFVCAKPELAEPETQTPEGREIIIIEAEDIARRNNPNIRTNASYNTSLTPYSNTSKMQNYIDDGSFRYGGGMVEYDFYVEQDGYYDLAFHYRQTDKAGFTVFRNIYIDGEIPNADYQNASFEYSRTFSYKSLPSAVYLTRGEHTLSLEISLDAVRYAILILAQVTTEMNELTMEITKVTGGNTSEYRDFNLLDYDIDAEDLLLYWAELIEQTHAALDQIKSVSGDCAEIEQLLVSSTLMRKLAEKPNDLPKRLDQFTRGGSSTNAAASSVTVLQYLINVSESLQFSQLGLDKIVLYQSKADIPKPMNMIQSAASNVVRFVYSFGQQEYTPSYDGNKSESLQVWVNRPRQYIEIMQNMIDTQFTPDTGIKVDLSIMPDQSKLILANASGKAPDVALSVASGSIYDLAIRGALYDMRQFDNFADIGSRFPPGLLIPGVLDEGVYAIPETFNFFIMFYRSDILSSMNLDVPQTMQEVRNMLPQLRRMGMNFNSHVSNFIVKPFAATVPFIYQSGGALYQDGTGLSNLDTEAAIEGMTVLTDNYTIYNMQYNISSFYQYFRDGRTPIGVSDYGTFNLLTNAAPELAGKWELALYPGVIDENGEIQRWTSGAAESDVIFQSTERPDESWKFLDWWMSTGVQTEFSFVLQTTLGNEYLWNTANTEALANAPWNRKHKAVILEQLEWIYETPRVPGGYMAERELSNAVDAIVSGKKLQTTIDSAVRNIDREIKRKLEEFGYTENGEYIKPLILPDIERVKEWLE